MTRAQLYEKILQKQSCLCVGLDVDTERIPEFLKSTDDPVFEFNKSIIEATADLCVAYKPNIAFYESLGPKGWDSLQKTMDFIPDGHFIIADAKRGDIGNTSAKYAQTFFETYNADAVTVAPYMGEDSVRPFLGFEGKWVILLALTSNPGSMDFQYFSDSEGIMLYERVLGLSAAWGTSENMMYVVGATHPESLYRVRSIVPDHFLLVPGVGAQGGSIGAVMDCGMNASVGLLINASRSILYAGGGHQFKDAARAKAMEMRSEMAQYINVKMG